MSDLPPPMPILQYATPAANAAVRPLVSGVLRYCGLYAGVIVPLGCFAFSVEGFPFGPKWQSGRVSDYIMLLLHAKAAWPLFPLLLYCMTAMAFVSIAPRRSVTMGWVRLGLWAGVPLAGMYAVILLVGMCEGNGDAIAISSVVGAVSLAVTWGVVALLNWSFRRFGARRVWPVLGSILAVVALIGVLSGGTALGVVFFGSIIFGPGWAMLIYLAMAMRVGRALREMEMERGVNPAAVAGLAGGFAASWGLAIHQAIRAYQALPTSPPGGCYIASAAARGHGWVVRAERVHFAGRDYLVNRQLRRLKCAEIALAAMSPSAHRLIRRIYNRVGPVLARGMRSRWLADVAYLTLWPVEKGMAVLLERGVADFEELVEGMYPGTRRQ